MDRNVGKCLRLHSATLWWIGTLYKRVRFEVLTAVMLKNRYFVDVTLFGWV